MAANLTTTFHDTVSRCFAEVLETMLGRTVALQCLDILETNGIGHTEISENLSRVIEVLAKSFAQVPGSFSIRQSQEVYREYSQKIDFGFYDKLDERLSLLRDKVIRSQLFPRHAGKRTRRHDSRTDSSTSEVRHLRQIDGDTSVVLSEKLNANNIGVSFLWERLLRSLEASRPMSWNSQFPERWRILWLGFCLKPLS